MITYTIIAFIYEIYMDEFFSFPQTSLFKETITLSIILQSLLLFLYIPTEIVQEKRNIYGYILRVIFVYVFR